MSTWHFVPVQFDKYPNSVEVHTESANDQFRAGHHPENRPPTMRSSLKILVGFKVYSDKVHFLIVKRYEQNSDYKVGCILPSSQYCIMRNSDHREGAPHFIFRIFTFKGSNLFTEFVSVWISIRRFINCLNLVIIFNPIKSLFIVLIQNRDGKCLTWFKFHWTNILF